jgi:hypothetical protein
LTKSTEETACIEKGDVKILPVSNKSPARQKAAQAQRNHATAKQSLFAAKEALIKGSAESKTLFNNGRGNGGS